MTMQLPDEIHDQITSLSESGDEFAEAGDCAMARQKYLAALQLLPGNPWDWEAATWLHVAIGDTHFHTGNFDEAFESFSNAVQCPQGLGNPYIHLRLGQLFYEQRNLDKAADELTRAYMGGGVDIFEEDDPKYLEFLQTRIEI